MTKYLLGIEIVGSHVKIATLRKGKELVLVNIHQLELPIGDEAYQTIYDWKLKNFKVTDEIIGAISISESSIFLERIRLPSIKKGQLDEALYWELSSISPFPVSEASYDWKMMSSENTAPMALVALAKSSYIDNWINLFEKAGIRIFVVEPSSISFSRLAKIDFSKRTLSLVVEEKSTDLVILEGGIPIFSTSINISVSSAKEDKRKLKKEIIDEIAESAKKIVSYWEEKEGKKIEQATITGYIANKYFGLASAINKFLVVPVVIAKSKSLTNFVHTGFNEISLEQNMVSIGVSLSLLDEKYVVMNLLTHERKKTLVSERNEHDLIIKASVFLKVNLAILVVLLVSLFGIFIVGKIFERNIISTKNKISSHQAQKLVQETKDNNRIFGIVNNLLLAFENKSEKINLLNSLTPEGIAFTSLEYKNIKGSQWIVTGIGGRDEIIAFYKKLQEKAGAKNISMPSSNFNAEEDNDFEITIIW